MPVLERLESLKQKHQEIDQQLIEEKNRPSGDDLFIARLKREKLRLKDEIQGLRQRDGALEQAAGY